MKTQLALFVDNHQWNWDYYMTLILMAYRSAHKRPHCIPAELMLGHELHLPVDLDYG